MAVDTSNYLVQYKSGGQWHTIPPQLVESISTGLAASGGDHPLGFGDSAEARSSLQFVGSAIPDLPKDTPFRVKFARASAEAWAHHGGLQKLQRTWGSVSITTTGHAERMRRTKAYSPAFNRRPVATKTTSSSIEDPANINYRAGLMNYLFWEAGGRPAAQDFLYPDAPFYYRCDQGLLPPTWSFVNGDDAYAAALDLAAACAGQVYQDETGVMVYRSPLQFAGGAQTYTFGLGPGSYGDDISYEISPNSVADVYLCQYEGRAVRPVQEIYNNQISLTIPPNHTEILELEPSLPIAQLETEAGGLTLLPAALHVTFHGNDIAPRANPGGYVHNVKVAAQRITLTIGNYSTRAMKVHRITLRGAPIVQTESGSVRHVVRNVPNPIVRTIPQNVFIQSRPQAARLCHLHALFTGEPRRVFSFTAPFDPNRILGERVGLTAPRWSLTNLPCIIIDRQLDETGRLCRYRLVDATGIPVASDFFQIGTQNYSGQTKKVGV